MHRGAQTAALLAASTISAGVLAASPAASATPSEPAPRSQQRILSDSFQIDQYLAGPSAAPLATNVAPPAAAVPAPTTEPEQRIASLGMRALLPRMTWPGVGVITTEYGEVGPTSPRGHAGLDIAGPEGRPVVAADDGTVIKAQQSDTDYGWLLVVAHPSGYQTWYAHLSSFAVELGQAVKKGDLLGGMGSTGYSTGSHVHFEVRQDGVLQDPNDFLGARPAP